MDREAFIGLAVLAAVIILGLLAMRGLARFARGFRQTMYEEASDLLRQSKLTAAERAYLTYCMDNAFSFRAGLLPLRAVWLAIRAKRRGEVPPVPRSCEEVQRVGLHFMASVLCANPFALVAFAAMLGTLMALEHERAKPAIRQTASKMPASYGAMHA